MTPSQRGRSKSPQKIEACRKNLVRALEAAKANDYKRRKPRLLPDKKWNADGTEWQRAYRAHIRGKVLTLLGNICVRCGFSDPRALQVDHIHGRGKASWPLKRRVPPDSTGSFHHFVLKNPKYFQLLCANCNWIKRHDNGELRGYTKRKLDL